MDKGFRKVRPLAVGTAARSPALPDVPTVAEQGYPGFEAALWLGVMGPANMPKPVVDRLHREIAAIVATPEFKALAQAHVAMIVAYRAMQWAEAEAAIAQCRTLAPPSLAGYYDIMSKRIEEFRHDPPPPDWDGVYVAKSKSG